FKRLYGPTDFSFNYGNVHFVILDNVQYLGWDREENVSGEYRGYLSEKQLQWLRNDLSFVPEDRLIVLAMHIPIASEVHPEAKIDNREKLFDILKFREHLLAICGHLHNIEHLSFTEQIGWQGLAPFPGISLGAACGAWWGGPKDGRAIPESFCLDGTPNGYFVFSFDGNRYNYHYYPANQPADHQMRIISPRGSIEADSLGSERIVVNVFNGGPDTTVMYSFADNRFRPMTRTLMRDPAMVELWQRNKNTFASWIEDVPMSSHIWTAALSTDLTPGLQTLKVRAVDRLGNIYTGEQTFVID
ncbi:calcineurin-like phosphoesterase C-terminal domain-containing protein, partial [bacterium]|nr:calcineurin-like phosphoesterase C-terminal domain-containing protein [bacterium]